MFKYFSCPFYLEDEHGARSQTPLAMPLICSLYPRSCQKHQVSFPCIGWCVYPLIGIYLLLDHCGLSHFKGRSSRTYYSLLQRNGYQLAGLSLPAQERFPGWGTSSFQTEQVLDQLGWIVSLCGIVDLTINFTVTCQNSKQKHQLDVSEPILQFGWPYFQNTLNPCLANFISSSNSAARKEHQNGFRVCLIPLQWLCVLADRYRELPWKMGSSHLFPGLPLPFKSRVSPLLSLRRNALYLKLKNNSIFPSQWLDARITLLAPVFHGLPWRFANFLKALNGMNLKKTASSNSSYDSERYSLCGPFIFSKSVGKIRLCLFRGLGGAGKTV